MTDTSVLIDLHRGGALPAFLHLPQQVVAPEPVVAELHDPPGPTVLALGLTQQSLAVQQVAEAIRLSHQYRKPSLTDLSALVLARDLQAPLLTSDRNLRSAATQEQVPVHGTLWVLDQLVRQQLVRPPTAATMLEQMVQQGSWLPAAEVSGALASGAVKRAGGVAIAMMISACEERGRLV